MNHKITLKEAFLAWEQFRLHDLGEMEHLDQSKLGELPDAPADAQYRDIEHLILCFSCLKELTEIPRIEHSTQFWDTAWRKAAATRDIQWPQRLTSADGIYFIEILQSEDNKNDGLINVSVSETHRDELEGRLISVVDGKGRVLLRGTVTDGEVFQPLANLEEIELNLMVRPLD